MTAKIVVAVVAEVVVAAVVETPDVVVPGAPTGGDAVVELPDTLMVVDPAASVVTAFEDDEHPRPSTAANRRTTKPALEAMLELLSLVPPP